jgi:hypothetical protein
MGLHLRYRLQNDRDHTSSRHLHANTTSIRCQRREQFIAVVRVVCDPSCRSLCGETVNFDRHRPSCCTALYDLDRNLAIQISERAHFRPTWSTTRTNSYGTRSHVPAPVRERPETFTGDERLLVVGNPNELGVCRATLHSDPVQVGRYIRECDRVVNLVGPE